MTREDGVAMKVIERRTSEMLSASKRDAPNMQEYWHIRYLESRHIGNLIRRELRRQGKKGRKP